MKLGMYALHTLQFIVVVVIFGPMTQSAMWIPILSFVGILVAVFFMARSNSKVLNEQLGQSTGLRAWWWKTDSMDESEEKVLQWVELVEDLGERVDNGELDKGLAIRMLIPAAHDSLKETDVEKFIDNWRVVRNTYRGLEIV